MILVDVEKATVSRPDRPLFTALSVTVRAGDRLGVVGRNGCGKSTLLRILAGAGEPEEGTVRRGRGVRVGYLDQEPVLPAGTVRAAVGQGLDGERGWEAEAILEHLGMGPVAGDDVATLSGGQTKRVALARVLVAEVDLLVLDEPTNGLDAAAAAGLRREVLDLVTAGTTVFLTTHLLAEAERMCDVVTVVKEGRVIAAGTPTELRRGARVRRVRVEGVGVIDASSRVLSPGAWTQTGPEGVAVTVDGLEDVPAVVAALVRGGAALHRVEPEGQTLEAAFLSLISEEHEDDPAPAGSVDGATVTADRVVS